MPENNKTEEFLEKLAPCIERGELEGCVEEAARVARETGIGAGEVFDLSVKELDKGNYAFTYVLALAAAQGLEENEKAIACANAGVAARFLGKLRNSEEHYKRAIEANPKYANAYYNYAILLSELERIEEAEQQYLKAIEADPKYASARYNYAILLSEMGRIREAEEHFKKAIDADPRHANAKIYYANLLKELNRKDEATEYYKKAIEADPKYALAHFNYATLLSEQGRMEEAEQQFLKAIESDPKYVVAHHNYAILLSELGRKDEAKDQYLEAIKANPNYANAHGAYGLLLTELDKRNDAWKETEKASNIFKETGNITQSYLAKAWFYERYSEKNFNRKKFWESGDDAGKAADEYLKAAETVDGALKDNFSQRGNILKAKSFVRKVPKKTWRRKILYWFGKNPDIPDIINNLKEAASYYEKAALCPIEERQDICNACRISITVFSETLALMEALINKRSPEMNKKEFIKKLDDARLIYKKKKMKNGVALVDTLIQLIICVDELAVHRTSGLGIQKEKCGKCYNRLTEVSENLDGALNIIAEHSIEAIREYAKKQGMGFVGKEAIAKFSFNKWLIGAIIAIFLGIVSNRLFSWDIDLKVLNYIKYIFFNQSAP